MNEITAINPEQFGLQKKEAINIEKAFEPKIKEREILSSQYGELVKKDITQETCVEATELRRKLVKVRTGISDIHKSQKSFFLAAGKFVDAWKNKETVPVTQMEDGLRKIENHFAEIEEAKLEVIRKERNGELAKYEIEYGMGDIAIMPPDVWKHFLSGVKSEFEEKKAQAARSEKERIEAQKKQDLFIVRKEKLIQFAQFGIYENLTINTDEKEFITLVEEGEKAKIDFDKIQAAIKSENDRLKRESIAKEKKEKELKARNVNRNEELRPYIVFIRDYNGLLNSEENEYRKELEDIKEGAELQWMSDRKEQQRKAAQEEIDRKEKERLRKESVAKIEADRKAELAPDNERLTKWISDMTIIDIVNDRMSKESVLMAGEIIDKFNKFKTWATEKVNEIR